MKSKQPFPYHMFLVGLFPLLSIYSHNTGYIGVTQFFRPAVVIALAVALAWGLFSAVYRDRYRAAVMVSIVLILTLSFKIRGACLNDWGVPGFAESYYRKLFCIDAVLMGGAFIGLWRLGDKRYAVNRVLNRALVILNTVAVVFALVGFIGTASPGPNPKPNKASGHTEDVSLTPPRTPPDIYYFILDGYGRSDVLQQLYGFDNSPFLQRLRGLGFLVADQSLTNYPHTIQSLSAALNMDYIDKLVDPEEVRHRTYNYVYYELINQSRSHKLLKAAGYQTVRNTTGWHYTTSIYADHNLVRIWGFTELESTLWSMTSGSLIVRYFSDTFLAFDSHRARILRAFQEVQKLPDLDSPTFAFIHILSPHPPFVFGRNGEPIDLWNPNQNNFLMDSPLAHGVIGSTDEERTRDYQAKYTDQAGYISDLVADAVTAILQKSKRPPVIVIQGDHGPHSLGSVLLHNNDHTRERFPILNAYYLPRLDDAPPLSQRDIDRLTPVNSFRLIFNRYFGTEFKTLPNRSFWVTPQNPFEYTPVPQTMIEAIQTDAPNTTPHGHSSPDR